MIANTTKSSMRNNSAQLALLTRQLREIGYAPAESWGNFLYIETGEDAAALARRLQMNGIIVRPLTGSWGARTAIRVTVGAPRRTANSSRLSSKSPTEPPRASGPRIDVPA